jgi:hypothetical protein
MATGGACAGGVSDGLRGLGIGGGEFVVLVSFELLEVCRVLWKMAFCGVGLIDRENWTGDRSSKRQSYGGERKSMEQLPALSDEKGNGEFDGKNGFAHSEGRVGGVQLGQREGEESQSYHGLPSGAPPKDSMLGF